MAQRQRGNREIYFRHIDFIFYREKQIRDAVRETRLNVRDHSISLFPVAGVSNTTSDPTAVQAVRNLTPLRSVTLKDGALIKFPEKWLAIIEKTYDYCRKQNDCRYEVARRRYNNEDYRKTCRELHISNSSRRRLLELVRVYAALQAVQAGLIHIN